MPARKTGKRHQSYVLHVLLVILAVLVVFIIAFYAQYNSVKIYAGTLPCADCSGIQTTLSLKGNHAYSLKLVYIGRNTSFTEIGSWQQEEKNNMQVYVLQNENQTSYYERIDPNTLRLLTNNAQPISAPFNEDL